MSISNITECHCCNAFQAPLSEDINIGDLLTLYDNDQLPTWYGLVTLITRNKDEKAERLFEITMLAKHNRGPFGLVKVTDERLVWSSKNDLDSISQISKWSQQLPSNVHLGWTQIFPRSTSCVLAFKFVNFQSVRITPTDDLQFVLIVVRMINNTFVSFRQLLRETNCCLCVMYEEEQEYQVDSQALFTRQQNNIIFEVPARKIETDPRNHSNFDSQDKNQNRKHNKWWSIDVSSLELPNGNTFETMTSSQSSSSLSAAAPDIVTSLV